MEAIHVVAKKYQQLGKTLHLTHLSEECRQMLRKAKDLITVSFSEEPQYHLTTDKFSAQPEAVKGV
jgi:SulP family sulfate permease